MEWIEDYLRHEASADEELELDVNQVKRWLKDADEQRDVTGPVDDPAEIAARIRALSADAVT